jgi:ABC-type proline/glycine betaine transport system permease subunit
MEEKELYGLFTKRLDIVSNIWLFAIGFMVGYVSTFATTILTISSQAGMIWTSLPSISLLLVTVVVLAIVLFARVLYLVLFGINPIHTQESLLKDYLEARKIIRGRAKP